MQYDPAVSAREALQQAGALGELGTDWETAAAAEDTFSSSLGPEATDAYETLLRLGAKYPQAQAFQAFLIFATWQQVSEETIARHFRQGAILCRQYLAQPSILPEDPFRARIQEIHQSFLAGLGEASLDDEEDIFNFDSDSFAGGD